MDLVADFTSTAVIFTSSVFAGPSPHFAMVGLLGGGVGNDLPEAVFRSFQGLTMTRSCRDAFHEFYNQLGSHFELGGAEPAPGYTAGLALTRASANNSDTQAFQGRDGSRMPKKLRVRQVRPEYGPSVSGAY